MKKKFLLITNNDNVWLKPSWSKVIKKLNNEFEFFVITVPEKRIDNKHSAYYYLLSFGILNFVLLGIFSTLRLFKYFRSNKKVINKNNSIDLKYFEYKTIQKYINEYKPDYIFISCSYIIPKNLLSESKKNTWFNKHASLLPKAKGVFPFIYNYINNDKQGISFHYVTNEIDSGDIIFSKEIDINTSMVSFYKDIYNNFDKYFIEFFKNYESGVAVKQSSSGTYYSYPNRKIIKKFQKLGGKIILFKDLINV